MPKVSIITPTYNGTRFIESTIESVQKQSLGDYEHIIINDCSSDDTVGIIQKYIDTDPRIKFINNRVNLGIANSRNRGIELSSGEYICFLDHDDIFLDTEKLQKQVEFLDSHSEYAIVSTNIVMVDKNGKELFRNKSRETDDEIRNHFLQSNQFLPCAIMLRKSILKKTGGFDSRYDKSDDYDLWMRIGRIAKMYILQSFMTGYRIHENNVSGTLNSLYHMRILAWKIFWKNRKYYPYFWKALIMRSIEFILLPKWVNLLLKKIKK